MNNYKVCAFDVNETLLNMAVLDPWFAEAFGRTEYRQIWFKTVLNTAWALTLSKSYVDFNTIGETTLTSLAAQNKITLSSEQRQTFKAIMKALPLHGDVEKALAQLKAAGYRLVALTNSPQAAATELLSKAKIMTSFDTCFSTDTVNQFKPAAAPYELVASEMKVPIENLWLIAAHAWDTTGAKKAGAKSALVRRTGHGQNALFAKPDVEGDDLTSLASQIISWDESQAGAKHSQNIHV